jgi:flagellar hook assembly protein FlgD
LAPESYLIGNYPNPFNPTTTIQFYLAPTAELIKYKFIRIYNLLGQLVSVIDISYLNTGTHALKFNGMDFNGNPLPSGMYLCQLVVGSEISTIRINLVK